MKTKPVKHKQTNNEPTIVVKRIFEKKTGFQIRTPDLRRLTQAYSLPPDRMYRKRQDIKIN